MLRFERVDFKYSSETSSVLEEVSFSLPFEDSLGIIGDTGSGKTTLGLLIAGILSPTGGEISWKRPEQSDSGELPVGMLFQNIEHQIVGETVEEDLVFGMENLGLSTEEMDRRLESVSDFLDLPRIRNSSINTLSDGEKKKVVVGAVLVLRPKILILDEPTASMDPWSREEFRQILTNARKISNFSLVLITHDYSELINVNRLLILKEGKIQFSGTKSEFRQSLREKVISTSALPVDLLFHQCFFDTLAK